jgi:hypothetical protein
MELPGSFNCDLDELNYDAKVKVVLKRLKSVKLFGVFGQLFAGPIITNFA